MTPDQMNAAMFAALSQIQADVAAIKAKVVGGGAAGAQQRAQSGGNGGAPSGPTEGAIASDSDLDSNHGDPTVKFDPKPKYWSGDSFAAYRFSECPPEYLDAMATYLDACAYMAEKDADEKKRSSARYKRMDAARARGWARRLRNGWGGGQATASHPADSTPSDYGTDPYSNNNAPF